jgi:DNA-directed RNA polymerase subunit L
VKLNYNFSYIYVIIFQRNDSNPNWYLNRFIKNVVGPILSRYLMPHPRSHGKNLYVLTGDEVQASGLLELECDVVEDIVDKL